MLLQKVGFPMFSWLNNIKSYFLYPFTYRGALRLFQYLGYYEYAPMNIRVQISLWNHVFISFGYAPRNGISQSYASSFFFFFEKSPHYFPYWLFIFPPRVLKSSLFSTFLPKLVTSCVFNNSHSNSCEVITHCAFDLHFLDDSWCWAPCHESVGHLEKRTYMGFLDDFEDDGMWNWNTENNATDLFRE